MDEMADSSFERRYAERLAIPELSAWQDYKTLKKIMRISSFWGGGETQMIQTMVTTTTLRKMDGHISCITIRLICKTLQVIYQ